MKNPITAKRLSEALNDCNMKAKELSERSGVSKASISQYMNGVYGIPNLNAAAFGKILGVNPLWLMGFDIEKHAPLKSDEVKEKAIPLYSAVSAGSGAFADGNIEEYIPLPPGLDCKDDYFALRIKGDSMEPVIMDRDIVIVRKDEMPEDGKTVIAIVNGFDGFCKRYSRQNGMVILLSNNSAYEPKIYTEADVEQLPVRFAGTVVKLMRDL